MWRAVEYLVSNTIIPAPNQAWASALHPDRRPEQAHNKLTGPGTDLRIGLLPTARWEPPTNVNAHGIEHAWNLPSEEVYTVPDPDRVDGHVTLTRPALVNATLIPGIELTFQHGRVVKLSAPGKAQALREYIDRDPGTGRLEELALVDGDSAVGSVGRRERLLLHDGRWQF